MDRGSSEPQNHWQKWAFAEWCTACSRCCYLWNQGILGECHLTNTNRVTPKPKNYSFEKFWIWKLSNRERKKCTVQWILGLWDNWIISSNLTHNFLRARVEFLHKPVREAHIDKALPCPIWFCYKQGRTLGLMRLSLTSSCERQD